MIILEGRNLTKKYTGHKTEVHALQGVSFQLEKGEILGVVGESGSGKSTLLRLISGLEVPDEGEVLLHGTALSRHRTEKDYRAMQMIFQDAAASFHPRRSIASSIAETVHSLCGKHAPVNREELCALVGISPELMDRFPQNLSGGQCQRFAIARAVSVDPQILLCDEITSALDVSSQAQILRLLPEICRKNSMSALFVSHDLAVVSCLCDRIMVMCDGAVVEQGNTRQIIEDPREEYTRRLIGSVMEI